MLISSAFPSNYLRAADLQGKTVRVTISHVNLEELNNDTKPVVYFEKASKGLVLNKTNSSVIAAAYGDETDLWSGQVLELYEVEAEYQARRVMAIRVRVPSSRQHVAAPSAGPNAYAEQSQPAQRQAERQPAMAGGDDLNDEVPF